MSLQPLNFPLDTVPEDTRRVAEAAFPRGNDYVRLRSELGPLFRDADFADLYSHRGRPAYSPGRLALVTAMQYMENCSDRQAAEAVRARIDWKYALALPLSDAGFDSSVLSEFRRRLLQGGAEERLLDRIVERLSEAGLVKKRGRQRTDSTRVLAAVRELNRLELVTETMRVALNELAGADPEFVRAVAGPEWIRRYGPRAEQTRLPSSKKGRATHAGRVGADGFKVLDALDARSGAERLRGLKVVQVLHRVWSEQYERPNGPEEASPRLQERRGRTRSGRTESPYDDEATYRRRSGKEWTGYMVHLSETCDEEQPRVVTHVDTTTADVHEARRTAGIHKALSKKGLAPGMHLTDSAYIDAGHLVSAEEQHGIRMIGPTRKNPSWQARANREAGGSDKQVSGGQVAYTTDQFEIDWQEKVLTCPEGERSSSWGEYTSKSRGDYVSVRFSRKSCQACRARTLCTKGEQRSLLLHPEQQHRALEKARQLMKTEEGKRLYAKRAGVEGTVSQAVRRCGLRRTRYRGLAKTHLGHLATAAALNLTRAAAWLGGSEPSRTRTSRFARLMTSPALAT